MRVFARANEPFLYAKKKPQRSVLKFEEGLYFMTIWDDMRRVYTKAMVRA